MQRLFVAAAECIKNGPFWLGADERPNWQQSNEPSPVPTDEPHCG
jgi:hypothetical protein